MPFRPSLAVSHVSPIPRRQLDFSGRIPAFVAVALLLLGLMASGVRAQPIAFPGAEGFGRFATGGRGGEVYVVTNLNDSGPGSLRAGVTGRSTSSPPRTVVFAVSGTIYLQSTLRITVGNLTIAGQTAPGDGICLAYRPLDISNSSNVIIRFLRVRLGDVAGVENDAFSSRYATNVIIDHCSFSWSVDETSSTYDNTNLTLQWCFITESLRDSVHSKGAHGYGGIWGGLGATYHHNLIAHHDSRNPRFNGARTHGTDGELVDMRNNVIYNWRGNSTYGGEPTDTGLPGRHNMVNNTYKPGPATLSGARQYRILDPSRNTIAADAGLPSLSLFHVAGNWTTASSTVTADNWNGGVQVISSSEFPAIRSDTPFDAPAVLTQTAQNSYPLVLAHAGCRLPARDPIDTRIAAEVVDGTVTFHGSKNNYPGIIDSQADVGGWPTLASTPAPADSDADGMPDAWELARGLDPADPADRNGVPDATTGYTHLELHLNELAASAFPIPTVATPPASQTIATGTPLTLSVAATAPAGTGTLAYQWYRGETLLDGRTAATLQITEATAADAGEYTVVVKNDYGSARSPAALVALENQPPLITTEPASLTVAVGQTAVFTVEAAGSPPLAYRWYRGTTPLPDDIGTAATLTLASVAPASAGDYHVVVTNPHGTDTSATATLTVSDRVVTTLFATDFSADTLHAAPPVLTASATDWRVMSSKNATATAVGDDPATADLPDPRLDLTMVLTSSGVIETAAPFAAAPLALAPGEVLTLRATLETTNVRVLSLGLFNSGGVPAHLGMNNGKLAGNATDFATGGTQGWLGYRAFIDAAASTPTATLEGRPAQAGASNASQSLLIPGTSSSATGIIAIGSASSPGFTYADGATYTVTLTVERGADDAHTIGYAVHAGTDTTAAPLATVSVPATGAGAPSVLAAAFDSLAIGYRNRDDSSVSRLKLTALSVTLEAQAAVSADPYELFLAAHGLDGDPDGAGAPDADPDGDGLPNALEFILGGSPADATGAPAPSLVIEASSPAHAAFVFTRHLNAEELFELVVENSTDLATWAPVVPGVDGVTLSVEPLDATHEIVIVRAPVSEPRVFFRLRATPR